MLMGALMLAKRSEPKGWEARDSGATASFTSKLAGALTVPVAELWLPVPDPAVTGVEVRGSGSGVPDKDNSSGDGGGSGDGSGGGGGGGGGGGLDL